MQAITKSKLLPPLALLRQAPGAPLRHPHPTAGSAQRSNLSTLELRRIVADLIG